MKLWLVDIIHALDALCNAYVLLYAVAVIVRAALRNKYQAYAHEWNYTDTLIWVALAGVVFIPSEAALKAMLGV